MSKSQIIFVLALLALMTLSSVYAVTDGTYCRSSACCYNETALDHAGNYSDTANACWTNSTRTVNGVCSTRYTCGIDISGMPSMGEDIGSFATGIAPGIGVFLIILGVFTAVGALVYAVVGLIKNKFKL